MEKNIKFDIVKNCLIVDLENKQDLSKGQGDEKEITGSSISSVHQEINLVGIVDLIKGLREQKKNFLETVKRAKEQSDFEKTKLEMVEKDLMKILEATKNVELPIEEEVEEVEAKVEPSQIEVVKVE